MGVRSSAFRALHPSRFGSEHNASKSWWSESNVQRMWLWDGESAYRRSSRSLLYIEDGAWKRSIISPGASFALCYRLPACITSVKIADCKLVMSSTPEERVSEVL